MNRPISTGKGDRVETAILEYITKVSKTTEPAESQFGQYVGVSLLNLSRARRRRAKDRIQQVLSELQEEEDTDADTSATCDMPDVFDAAFE